MSSARLTRKTALIVNRDTCGGVKKQGLAPKIGALSSNKNYKLRRAHNGSLPRTCLQMQARGVTRNPTQPGSGIGKMYRFY